MFYNIKMDLNHHCDCTQATAHWQAFVNKAMKLRVPEGT